jgi:3-hydroxyacyl-CoA dehydrogenase
MPEVQHGAIRGAGGPLEADALRHVLDAEQAAGGTVEGAREVRCVGVVGAGTMGAGIALTCAQAELQVELVDSGADARARVRTSEKLEALGETDLIIEAVFEDAQIKQEVFARSPSASIARSRRSAWRWDRTR